jgi:hypothetical protein
MSRIFRVQRLTASQLNSQKRVATVNDLVLALRGRNNPSNRSFTPCLCCSSPSVPGELHCYSHL